MSFRHHIIPYLVLLLFQPCFAQTRHALLVGIDDYAPAKGYAANTPAWVRGILPLTGCKNDAMTIKAQIIARFGFKEEQVKTLYDQEAKRQAILSEIGRLLADSHPGDIVLIYYAGHGTQVINSLSDEADKLDESIVPADVWQEGVQYIRDKELAVVWNKFIDKGVFLTLIFDCCHSGSLSRGPDLGQFHYRYAPNPRYDAADGQRPPRPETRPGDLFLALSASNSDERAYETKDDQGIPHGAFTSALNELLNEKTTNETAMDLYASVKAILANNGLRQQPVISGSPGRMRRTLLGDRPGALSGTSMVAVEGVEERKVLLQGGYALGLAKGLQLSKFSGTGIDTSVSLEIDTVLGINRSLAHLSGRQANTCKRGDEFAVTNWVSPDRPLLKVCIPATNYTDQQVRAIAAIAGEVKKSGKLLWVKDLSVEDPYYCLFYKDGISYIKTDKEEARPFVFHTARDILNYCKKVAAFYMEVPVSGEAAAAFSHKIEENRSIRIVSRSEEAYYILFGKPGAGEGPAYGFRKVQVSSRDSLEAMPVSTACYEYKEGNAAPDSLFEAALKLSKIRGWLSIIHSPESGGKLFPYHLEIYNTATHASYSHHSYTIGDAIGIRLIHDMDKDGRGVRMFVYVFALDRNGKMTLLSADDNDQSLFIPYDAGGRMVKEKIIAEGITVSEPSGTDNYFLLATEEAIQNPSLVFNQDGVGPRELPKGMGLKDNPLSLLLNLGNEHARSISQPIKVLWQLEKLSFKCNYR